MWGPTGSRSIPHFRPQLIIHTTTLKIFLKKENIFHTIWLNNLWKHLHPEQVDKVNKGAESADSVNSIIPHFAYQWTNEEVWMWVVAGGLLACLSSVPQVVTTVHAARIRAHGSGLWVFSPWISYCAGLARSPPPTAQWPPHPQHQLYCGHPTQRGVKAQYSLRI